MAVVAMSYLLEAGVHFGHQTKRWNPKMKEYIFTARDEIYIIDLQKTAKMIDEAYEALKEIAANGGKVLFVGTRKQAQEAIKEEALRSESYYVTERWLGGTLTNFKTIRRRVKRLEEIEKMEKDGIFDLLPKKEVKLPNALFIVDPSKEANAINEARILGIPVFGIVDTNCDPDMVDYVIPGNDDAIRAVKLITSVMANAIVEANGGKVIDYVTEEAKVENTKDIMEQALETVKKKENKKPALKKANDNNKKPLKKVEKKEITEEQEKEAVVVEEKVVNEEKASESKDLTKLTVAELREMAKAQGVKGSSTMKKAELIEALK